MCSVVPTLFLRSTIPTTIKNPINLKVNLISSREMSNCLFSKMDLGVLNLANWFRISL